MKVLLWAFKSAISDQVSGWQRRKQNFFKLPSFPAAPIGPTSHWVHLIFLRLHQLMLQHCNIFGNSNKLVPLERGLLMAWQTDKL